MLDVSASPEKFTPCIRLLIADPQPIVLQGLKSVFAAQHDFEIVASCSCGAHFLEAVRNLAPDVALVAGTLPDLTASEILAVAKAEGLPTRLMFFAEPAGNNDVAAVVAAGACHIVSSYAEPDVILRSVRLAADRAGALAKPARDPSRDSSANHNDIDGARTEKLLAALTHRERQIVQLVSEGLSNKEIARELNVSRGTVKVHLYNIFQKLEVNNRTVLATIALLQRSTGFTTLSLALALAIASDVDPSEASVLPDDASGAPGDSEHPALASWNKPIFQHALHPDSPAALAQKGSATKESQVAHSAARIEGPSGAGQAASPGNGNGRGHGAVGSGASALLVSPLQPATDSRQAGNPVPPQPFPPLEPAPNTIRNYAGHAIVALTAAGMALDTLDLSHAAGQVVEPGETLKGATVVAIQDGATHVAKSATDVAGHVAPAVANPASDPAEQGVHAPTGGSGNDTIKGNGGDDAIHGGAGSDLIDGNHAAAGGDGGDKPTGGEDSGLAHRSAADSKSARLDSIGNLTLGPDRINLAAFGALAFLQLTSASQSIPPHTLAWIYNAVSNETIVYLNPTDRSLDIGDAGLLEIHLQGVVSAAEVESVSQPDAAVVAAALEGIDPALLSAAANDGTVLTADGVDASIDTATTGAVLSTAGAWGMQAEDGFRFHFGRDRAGPGASTMLASFDEDSSAVTEPPDLSAAVVPVHVLPIEVAHSHAANPAGDDLSFKSEPVSVSAGAVTIAHGNPHATAGYDLIGVGAPGAAAAASAAPAEVVEPGAAQGNGHAHDNGHDNAQRASQSASADASEPAEPGPASGNGVGHGNSQPPSHAASAQAFLDVEPADTPGRGNSQASHPASANAADPGSSAKPSAAPGNSAGHSKHASNLDVEQAPAFVEPAEPGDPPGHGNSQPPAHAAAGKSAEPDVSKGGGGHGNSQASHPASANAADPGAPTEPSAAPGNAAGHSKHASNLDVEQAPAFAEPTEPGDPPGHGNSQPPAHAAAGKSAEPDVSKGGGGHGNSQASHPASANAADPGAPTEPSAAPGNAVGHSKHASNLDVEQAPASAEPAAPGDPPGHGNLQSPAHAAAGKSAEPDVLPGGGGQGNSHALHPASANAADPAAPAEPGAAPGNAAGHLKHASNLDVEQASASAEPAAPGDSPGHGNSQPPSHAAAGKSAEPDVPKGAGSPDNSDISHPAFANAADPGAPAEPSAAPGNGAGNAKHASIALVEQVSAPEPAEPSAPSAHANAQSPLSPASADMMEVNGGGHGNASQPSHPSASPPASLQPAEPLSGGGKPDQAFQFKNDIPSSTLTAASDPTDFSDAPAPVLHSSELTAILETSPPPVEVHGASHVNNGQHHAVAHGPPDLLT